MISIETYADLPRKLGHHAFIILALIQAADMMGERPVTAQWLYDHAPGYGKNSITDALRKLTSVENQLVVRVAGGWQLNKQGAFQLPLGFALAEGENPSESENPCGRENHSESDSAIKIIDVEPEKVTETVIEDVSENPCGRENHSESDSCFKNTPENHSKSDSHTRNPLKTLKSLNQEGGGEEILNLTPPPPDLSDEPEKQSDWREQNQKMLNASWVLFGEPGVLVRGLDLDAIPPEIVRGWLNQAYFLGQKGQLNAPGGLVYNRLKDYPGGGEKPKAVFLHAGADAYLPDEFLIEIGVKRKICELCGAEFESLAVYREHFEMCAQTYRNQPREGEQVQVALEPDETITEQILAVWSSILEEIQKDMPKASFDTWVRDANPVRLTESNRLIIAVRNVYARDWLTGHLKSTLERYLGREVEFMVPG